MEKRLTDESQVAEVNEKLGLPNEVGGVAYRIGDKAPHWFRGKPEDRVSLTELIASDPKLRRLVAKLKKSDRASWDNL